MSRLSSSTCFCVAHQEMIKAAASLNGNVTWLSINSKAIPSFRYSGIFSGSSSVLIYIPDISMPKPCDLIRLSKAFGKKLEFCKDDDSSKSSRQLLTMSRCFSESCSMVIMYFIVG